MTDLVAEAPAPLAALLEPTWREERRRALVIVNPYATTVSDRLRDLVLHALASRYEVEAADTEARGHATEICREAVQGDYDVVIAFGGDGTVNEAANGLAGSDVPLTALPGGTTNVYCKLLGIPGEIIAATERLLRTADHWHPRRVGLGRVNDRYFTFTAGLGIDAGVVRHVDRHPSRKARFGGNYFVCAALWTYLGQLRRTSHLTATVHGRTLAGITAIIQNGEHYTYLGDRPIDAAEGGRLDDGTLAGIVLERANLLDVPSLLVRGLSRHAALASHRHIESFAEATELVVESADGRPLPLHVDGDYVADVQQASFEVHPGALTVVA